MLPPATLASPMEPKPLLRIAGPAWELARYFLFVVFLAASSSSSGTADMLSAPWLAAVAAGGLAMPAAFFVYAFVPGRYAAYLPLLRLGKVLELASLALLYATGTIRLGSTLPYVAFRVPVLDSTPVVFGLVALLDAAVLAGLLRVRTGAGPTGSP
jgi:hypothetical protein